MSNDDEQPFKPIGSVVDQVDQLPDEEVSQPDVTTAEDEERPLQEIESYCVNCGENVRARSNPMLTL